MDSTPPAETADRDYERSMKLLKRRIASKDSQRMFLWSFMREAAKRQEGWESAANRLVDAWESYLIPPWRTPSGVDPGRAAFELVEFFWPIFMEWREGFVDQSEFHILVRSGGTELTKDEPPGIDVAVIGPGEFGELVVEFLPMFGVDPEAAREATGRARWLFDLVVDRCRGDAWSYAQHHCGTGANMYSLVRFVPRGGQEPWQAVNLRDVRKNHLVSRQAPRAEHCGASGRTTLVNDGECCVITAEHCGDVFRGVLLDLTHDTATVRLWGPPLGGGTMRRKIFAPYQHGYLVDERGCATDYGVEIMGELVSFLGLACRKLLERMEDIQHAVAAIRSGKSSDEGTCSEEEFAMLIRESLPGPRIDVDVDTFRNIVGEWVRFYGL